MQSFTDEEVLQPRFVHSYNDFHFHFHFMFPNQLITSYAILITHLDQLTTGYAISELTTFPGFVYFIVPLFRVRLFYSFIANILE
jgi:hypothetical protein